MKNFKSTWKAFQEGRLEGEKVEKRRKKGKKKVKRRKGSKKAKGENNRGIVGKIDKWEAKKMILLLTFSRSFQVGLEKISRLMEQYTPLNLT